MKIIHVDTPIQDENTENPQMINGKFHTWCVKTTRIRNMGVYTYLDWLYHSKNKYEKCIDGFYLYSIQPRPIYYYQSDIDEYSKFVINEIWIRFDYIKSFQKK